MTVYSEEITRYLEEDFGEDAPEIILEPGRSLAAESGILVSEVVLISPEVLDGRRQMALSRHR